MSFVGIDTALGTIGLCAFDPEGWIEMDAVSPGKRTGPARLKYLKDAVEDWLDGVGTVTYAAIEDGAFHGSGRLFQLGGIQHIIQLSLWDRVEIALVEPTPAQLKKFQTAKSGALKEWMVEAANNFLESREWSTNPPAIKDDNIADAVGLARIAYALHTEKVTTRAEASVVVALQKSTRIHKVPNGPR